MLTSLARTQTAAERRALRLWPIGAVLAVVAAVGLFSVVGLGYLALRLLGISAVSDSGPAEVDTLLELAKVVLAVVAGGGAIVALVMAYRRQRVAEAENRLAEIAVLIEDERERREAGRAFNERFGTAAGQLGAEHASTRLAGVYAMATLADDWEDMRQTCLDVLCGHLRMSGSQYLGTDTNSQEFLTWAHNREVRHTIIRVITEHLQPTADPSWIGRNLDFSGATFDGGDFSGAVFRGGNVRFGYSQFIPANQPHFDRRGERIDFRGALFDGASVRFGFSRVSDGTVDFRGAEFRSGTVDFGGMELTSGRLFFGRPGTDAAAVTGGRIYFGGALLAGGIVDFSNARIGSGSVDFGEARFEGAEVDLASAQLTGGTIDVGRIVVQQNPPVLGVARPGLNT